MKKEKIGLRNKMKQDPSKIILMLACSLFLVGNGAGLMTSDYQELYGWAGISIIQETTLLPLSAPPQKSQVLASLVEDIIYCESKGDPTAENPKSTAYGLCQFLDGTWDYVQDKWGMELDRDDPNDQLYACERLLEEESLDHWEAVSECLKGRVN